MRRYSFVIDFTMSRGNFVSLKTSSVSGRFSTAFLSSMDASPARRRKSESFPRLWIGASYGRTECLLFQSYMPSPKTRIKDQGKISASIFITVANRPNPFSLILVKNELGAFSESLGPPLSRPYPIMTVAGL